LSTLSGLIVCDDELFWSSVTIMTSAGARTVRGFPNRSLKAVVETANLRLEQHVLSRYAYLDSEIVQVAGEAERAEEQRALSLRKRGYAVWYGV